jgi:hypothetical protein
MNTNYFAGYTNAPLATNAALTLNEMLDENR